MVLAPVYSMSSGMMNGGSSVALFGPAVASGDSSRIRKMCERPSPWLLLLPTSSCCQSPDVPGTTVVLMMAAAAVVEVVVVASPSIKRLATLAATLAAVIVYAGGESNVDQSISSVCHNPLHPPLGLLHSTARGACRRLLLSISRCAVGRAGAVNSIPEPLPISSLRR